MLFSLPAGAHPGKTDRSGGHSCRKDCSVWDLYIGEYHHHDDYGRPLRVDNKTRRQAAPVAEVTTPENDLKPPGPPLPENIPAAPEKAAAPASPPRQQDKPTDVQPLYEAYTFPVNLLWLLVMAGALIVLLIALIIRRKKAAAR